MPEQEHTSLRLTWRGDFTNREVNELHAEAFETRVFSDEDWDWQTLCSRHSLGWVTARRDDELVGFANVLWDGFVHAWLQDVMVAATQRGSGVGRRVVAEAADGARRAGCEHLHVDFDDDLVPFYISACGFEPAQAGVMEL